MAHYLTTKEGLPLTLNESENVVQMVTAGSEPVSVPSRASRHSRCHLANMSSQTATFSTGLCYFLTRNPTVYEKLKAEIRTAFTSMEDLNLADLAQLKSLNHVIREGLRVFPPAADIFPRIIPEGGEVVIGKLSSCRSKSNIYQPL